MPCALTAPNRFHAAGPGHHAGRSTGCTLVVQEVGVPRRPVKSSRRHTPACAGGRRSRSTRFGGGSPDSRLSCPPWTCRSGKASRSSSSCGRARKWRFPATVSISLPSCGWSSGCPSRSGCRASIPRRSRARAIRRWRWRPTRSTPHRVLQETVHPRVCGETETTRILCVRWARRGFDLRAVGIAVGCVATLAGGGW